MFCVTASDTAGEDGCKFPHGLRRTALVGASCNGLARGEVAEVKVIAIFPWLVLDVAVIVMSDGVDTGSENSLASAIEAAQRADTMVYSILFSDASAYGVPLLGDHDGRNVLMRMSRETGAGFFEVSKKQSIEQIFDVRVLNVNTLNRKGQRKRQRKKPIFGKRADTKRAIVTLAEGDRIPLFES